MNNSQNQQRQPINPEQFRTSVLLRLCIGIAVCVFFGVLHTVFSVHDGLRILALGWAIHFALVYSYQIHNEQEAMKLYLYTGIVFAALIAFLVLRNGTLPLSLFLSVGGYAVYCYVCSRLDKKDEQWYSYASIAAGSIAGTAFVHFLFFDVFFYASQGHDAAQGIQGAGF